MEKVPLRKLGSKRRKEVNLYLKARKPYLEEHPICEACNEAPADQIHHMRGRLNELVYNEKFFMAVCWKCHGWIENNREAARNQGWLLDRLGNL